MNAERKMKLCSWAAAILMVLMLVCQFLPYWHHGDGLADSIQGYIWFPSDKPELAAYLQANDEAYNINSLVWPIISIMVLCAVGAIFCLWKSSSSAACLFPAASGALGLWFYLTEPAMRLGSAWGAHVLLFVLMLLTAILNMVFSRKAE